MDDVSAELLTQMAVESLVEDEALRGHLSDWGYQPLLDWAIGRIMVCAQEAAEGKNAQPRLESCLAQLRQILRAAANAAEQGDVSLVASLLGQPIFRVDEEEAIREELSRLAFSDDLDGNAQQIARTLSARQRS